MVNYIRTQAGIHMVLGGKPVAVASTDKHYDDVVAAIKGGASEADIQAIIERELARVSAAVEVTPDIQVKGGELYYKGQVVHNVLADRMLRMLDEGFDVRPMAAFLANLMENPSYRVVEHLYAFIEHGKCPITDDGCFLAYKAVRADYRDIHSGLYDNSIGQVLEMPRNRVDEDPNNTCSHGFHVCSFDYLPHFSHANGHVVVCKVNPRDVVAIPRDYNNTKMRVCRYEVVGEHEGYYRNAGDTLANTSVAVDTSDPFRVEVDYGHGFETESSHARLSEAAEALENFDRDNVDADWHSARLVNSATGAVLQTVDNPHFSVDDPDDESADADEASYSVHAERVDGSTQLVDEDINDLAEAMRHAVTYAADAAYSKVTVIDDRTGEVVKTIS